ELHVLPATLTRPRELPAGERPRDFDHILLRIAAVHAERVQLHELACIVLVETAGLARPGRQITSDHPLDLLLVETAPPKKLFLLGARQLAQTRDLLPLSVCV